jgi:hypothetical protein
MSADERRREAEIVGRKAQEAEKKAARLRARQRELLGETPDEEKSKLFFVSVTCLSRHSSFILSLIDRRRCARACLCYG